MNTPALQRAVFLLLLAGSTLAFLWVLTPFFGAVFWAIALAMLFNPLFQRLRRRLGGRANLAALLTLLIALVIVILPMIMVAGSLVDDMTSIVQRMRAGDINLRTYFNQIVAARWWHAAPRPPRPPAAGPDRCARHRAASPPPWRSA